MTSDKALEPEHSESPKARSGYRVSHREWIRPGGAAFDDGSRLARASARLWWRIRHSGTKELVDAQRTLILKRSPHASREGNLISLNSGL